MLKFIPFSILFATIPLFNYLPIWVSSWCLIACFIQLTGISDRFPKFLGSIFAIVGFIILFTTNSAYYSLDFCVALLALMTSIKPLENNSHRDKAVSICMAYFVTLTGLWYSNNLSVAFYSLFSILICTTCLGIANNAFYNLKNSSKLASRILLQSAPFALILFVSFPRLNGSLWGLNVSADTASGFSDSISMGELSQMAKDDSPAFRVEFLGRIPYQKYWRGIVFSYFDGKTWKEYGENPPLINKREGSNPVSYNVILEPHGKKWMFSLDYPIFAPRGSKQTQAGVLISDRPITERKMYRVTSVSAKSRFINRSTFRINTRIPKKSNPRTMELVSSWKAKGITGEDLVKEAQRYLSSNNFKYSLEPPITNGQHIDDFLFRTKEGYCEHFASAFTFMMRAANIPARVVGGYLGGELNSNYLIVRQSDAHVWTEVWLDKYGWIRIDPTKTANGADYTQAGATQAASMRSRNKSLLDDFLSSVTLKIDAVNFAWDKWVLGYDREQQLNLLKSLGLAGKYFLISFIVFGLLGLTLALGLLAAYFFSSAGRKKSLDNVAKSYEKLISKFSKKGLEKPASMGPLNYQIELETAFPELKESIDSIIQLYIKLRFEENPTKEDETIFTKKVNELKVKESSISKNHSSV